jgi:hypothetical protein
VIDPLQVLEHEQQRDIGRNCLYRLSDLAQHALSRRPENLPLQHFAVRLREQCRKLRKPSRCLRRQDVYRSLTSVTAAQLADCFQHRIIGFSTAISFDTLSAGNAEPGHRGARLNLKRVGDRGLADPRFPGNENDLSIPEHRTAQGIGQFAQGSRPPHQTGARGSIRRRRLRPSVAAVQADKPIPAPRQRLDEPRTFRIIIESAPDIQYLTFQAFGLYVRIGPDGIEQLVLRDQSARATDEVVQHAVCLGRQQKALIVSRIHPAPQTLVGRVKPEGVKLRHHRSHLDPMVAIPCASIYPPYRGTRRAPTRGEPGCKKYKAA